jgi:hypothetical protein
MWLSQHSAPPDIAAHNNATDRPGESLSPPAAPTLLAIFSALSGANLPALARGLEQFINHLEKTGEEVAGDNEGFWTWLAAGVVAAVAREIARRQIKGQMDPATLRQQEVLIHLHRRKFDERRF